MYACLYIASILMTQMTVPLISGSSVSGPVQFAAEELGRYIMESTSSDIDVTYNEALNQTNALLLGTETSGSLQLQFPESSHREAYRIYTPEGGGRIFTANSPGALLFAVYDFLETSLGYRWYFPYPEDNIIPAVTLSAFNNIMNTVEDRETEPAFSFRSREFRDVSPMTDATDDHIVYQIDWWAKLRMNRFLLNFGYVKDESLWSRWRQRLIPEIKRRGMLVGVGEHGSYPLFLPPHRYTEAHPDWYCEIAGKRIGDMHTESGEWAQFCTTNPGAVKTYLDNFTAFVLEHPEIDFYYPAPNDVGRWCECEQCRELSIADRYLQLNNQIAEAVNKVKPGTRIMHLAYSNHRLPPENTLPHNMIDVDVACWGRDFSYSLCDQNTMPDDTDYIDVFRQWAALCGNTGEQQNARLLYHWKIMRQYWLGMHLLPLSIMDEDFKCIQELGIAGFDLPLGFLGIWTKALNTYAAANKCWNPDTPSASLADRFMKDYYGEYADKALRLYELAEDAFKDRRYGRSLTLAWFPDTSKVRDTPLEGLGENARHALLCLEKAITILEPHLEGEEPFASRFRKLNVVLRHARDEQEVLAAFSELMNACHALKKNESDVTRHAAIQAWEAAKAANDALAASYAIEEDEAGLYWDGMSYKQLQDALAKWRQVIENVDWQIIGQWETEDFNNATTPIIKRLDVTETMGRNYSGTLQVRFNYTGGELGASIRRVSLHQTQTDGSSILLAEDKHSGFAGYVHENAAYLLDVESTYPSDARLVIEVELAAYATSGRVSERGCKGDILIGLSKDSSNSN